VASQMVALAMSVVGTNGILFCCED
jgi:hypothetical protein